MLSQTTTTCNVTLENALELNVGLKDHTYHCSEGGPRLPSVGTYSVGGQQEQGQEGFRFQHIYFGEYLKSLTKKQRKRRPLFFPPILLIVSLSASRCACHRFLDSGPREIFTLSPIPIQIHMHTPMEYEFCMRWNLLLNTPTSVFCSFENPLVPVGSISLLQQQ